MDFFFGYDWIALITDALSFLQNLGLTFMIIGGVIYTVSAFFIFLIGLPGFILGLISTIQNLLR